MNVRTFTLAVVILACAPRLAPAQRPDDATPAIEYGETVNDVLTTRSDTLSDGSYYKQYVLAGTAGDVVTISLSTEDFNANLLVFDAMDNVLASDDNGGEGCNAHLTTALTTTGWYFIVANAVTPNEIGRFELTVRSGEHPPGRTEPCRGFTDPQGVLAVGDTVRGAIESEDALIPGDSTHYQVWVLAPAVGQTMSVDLVSSEFDSTLFLVRGLSEVVMANDDGGGGCNARLVFTPDEERPYRLITRAVPAGAIGSFRLTVTEGAKPVMQQSTCEPPGP